MELHLPRFFKACNPAKTLDMGNPEDHPYYIDFSAVTDLGHRSHPRLARGEPVHPRPRRRRHLTP
ncbi:hypothetical protein, partial [Moorena sp. SIO1F2]|uniref:hypothetical protein n=1 Tax=Moorena sp. SIO1F2 TaxID=2607819 RepID=UPI0025F61278